MLTVLPYGAQARVTADVLRMLPASAVPALALLSAGEIEPAQLAAVIPASSRLRATGDPALRSLLARGASLCLVDQHGLNSWLPILQSRRCVAVEPSLVEDVGGFVPWQAMRRLPESGGWAA
jgi:hypothetical protein